MPCKFLPVVVSLLVLLFSIAATRMDTETVLSMLDSSLCGSELENESSDELENECATEELEEGATRENNDRGV